MRAERMRPPAACEAGLGVVTVGRERASVHSLAAAIGVAAQEDNTRDRDRHIIVLRAANGPVGWLVDRVSRAHLPTSTRVLPLPALVGARAKRWFAGVLSTPDRPLLLLSLSPTDHDDGSASRDLPQVVHTRSTPASSADSDEPLVVTFRSDALHRCGAGRYAVSARRVAGVESGLDVLVVPGSESPVIGVTVWRGEVLPVLDFRNATHGDVDRRRLLLVRCGGPLSGTSVAIAVDAETALCQPTHDNQLLDPTRIGAAPMAPYIAGLFDVRGQTVALIDPDRLLHGYRPVVARFEGQHDTTCASAGRESSVWTQVGPRASA